MLPGVRADDHVGKNRWRRSNMVNQPTLKIVNACAPSKLILDKSNAHPWITTSAEKISKRLEHAALWLERDACSSVFLTVYHEYVMKRRETLRTMEPSSQGWWKITNSLLTKRNTSENIPALQRQDGFTSQCSPNSVGFPFN